MLILLSVSAQELRGLGYTKGKPVGLVGVTELSDDQKKQIKEQQDVGNTTIITFLFKMSTALYSPTAINSFWMLPHRCRRCTTSS